MSVHVHNSHAESSVDQARWFWSAESWSTPQQPRFEKCKRNSTSDVVPYRPAVAWHPLKIILKFVNPRKGTKLAVTSLYSSALQLSLTVLQPPTVRRGISAPHISMPSTRLSRSQHWLRVAPHHGCGAGCIGIHLEDGHDQGNLYGIFLTQDEDSFTGQ